MNNDPLRGGVFQSVNFYHEYIHNQINENKRRALEEYLLKLATSPSENFSEPSIIDKHKQKELFQLARKHFFNALNYKAPRQITMDLEENAFFTFVYELQTSHFWQRILLIFSYIFMYLVLISFRKPNSSQIIAQIGFLFVFWLDVGMQVYHKSFDNLRKNSRFQSRFYQKVLFLVLLTIDEIAAIVRPQEEHFLRPFLIIRCFLPPIYAKTLRKNMKAMFSLYKQIIVFTFFYGLVIFIFTIFLHRFVGSPQTGDYDKFTQNYEHFGIALFNMYALSSFESYPDNQLRAIRQHPPIYMFFIFFIVLNLFLFVTIPTSLLFNQFKEYRSRIILVDEIKQQSSLILAFTVLCQNKKEISIDKFSRFLLYCFRNKSGYINQIVKVTEQIDENNNGKIQATQFMQILKIMNSYPSMYPPNFDDWQPWIRFRKYVNQKLKLKHIVLSIQFKIMSCIFIIFSITNCLLVIYLKHKIFVILEYIIAFVFLLELVAKFVGLGPENYFKDPWNRVDFFLIIFIFVSEMQSAQQKTTKLDVIFKLARAYRIALLPQYLASKTKNIKFQDFSMRVSRLVTQLLMTIPIVFHFFPMYIIAFYFFGVLGLQIYGNSTPVIQPQSSSYSDFAQFSNFDSFLQSQFLMVQVLIEAGWSVLAVDHAARFSYPVALTLLFFTINHFSITLVISSLVKGVTWEVYQTLQEQHNKDVIKNISLTKMQERIDQRNQQLEKYQTVHNQIENLENLLKRQIFQAIIDGDILRKMQQAAKDSHNDFLLRRKTKGKPMLMPMLVKQLSKNYLENIQMVIHRKSSQQKKRNHEKDKQSENSFDQNYQLQMSQLKQTFRKSRQQTTNMKDKLLQSFNVGGSLNKQVKILAAEATINQKTAYRESICYPVLLIDFLSYKMISVEDFNAKQLQEKNKKEAQERTNQIISSLFKGSKQHEIYEQELQHKKQVQKCQKSLIFVTDAIKSLIGQTTSEQFQKSKIYNNLIQSRTINRAQASLLKKYKKSEKGFWLDQTWVLRQTFLDQTSQKLVQKFEIQYFTRVYGKGFKDYSKKIVEPLFRMESKLTYCLRNALRCVQMDQLEFFTILNKIQDRISSRLLKSGSLFKFVYQIDSINDLWFTISINKHDDEKQSSIRFNFIKNGVWLWHKGLKQNKIYMSEDFFNTGDWHDKRKNNKEYQKNQNNQFYLERYIKSLFQSFESMAIGLPNMDNFFTSRPSEQIYNLYCHWKNIEPVPRQEQKRFYISKIMTIMLSHEGKRTQNDQIQDLPYQLSDIKVKQQQGKGSGGSKYEIHQSFKDLLNKINKLQTMDELEIGDDELSHPFKVNFFEQISDILESFQSHFVYRVQKVLNQLNKNEPFATSQRLSQVSNMQSHNLGQLFGLSRKKITKNYRGQVSTQKKKARDDNEIIFNDIDRVNRSSDEDSSIGQFYKNPLLTKEREFSDKKNQFILQGSHSENLSGLKNNRSQFIPLVKEEENESKIVNDGKSLANSEQYEGISDGDLSIHGEFSAFKQLL